MRGKVIILTLNKLLQRITPAYAGKRGQKCRRRNREKDHPRLCGEKYGYYTIEVISLGSPPPMRGKANIGDDIGDDFRITPAYAGKSSKKFDLSNCK